MPTLNLLYKDSVPINDKISVQIPSVREVIQHEDEYYHLVQLLTAMPIDMMVLLDTLKINFTEINDYDLFLMLFSGIAEIDTTLVFGDLDLHKFEPAVNTENGKVVLLNEEDGIVIDRAIQNKIASVLRQIHHLEKNLKTPGNEEGYKYMLERAKVKARRNSKKAETSRLEPLVVALVNTEQFKYNYESVLDLSIYQFNESVRQIIHKVEFDNRMIGVYSGTINAKECSPEELNWLTHK